MVRFLCRYIGDHRFTRILIDVTNTLLSIYEDTFEQFSGEIGRNFLSLAKMIRKEENLTMEFLQLQGSLEMIMAGASFGEETETNEEHRPTTLDSSEFLPSKEARENVVISV